MLGGAGNAGFGHSATGTGGANNAGFGHSGTGTGGSGMTGNTGAGVGGKDAAREFAAVAHIHNGSSLCSLAIFTFQLVPQKPDGPALASSGG